MSSDEQDRARARQRKYWQGAGLPLFRDRVDAGSFRQEKPIEQSGSQRRARNGVLSSTSAAKRRLEKESTNKIYRDVKIRAKKARDGRPIDYSGSCVYPVISYVQGRPILVRCRWCPMCNQARSYHWSLRAIVETIRHERTLFCTLTFNPHFRGIIEKRVSDGEAESIHKLAYEQTALYAQSVKRWVREDDMKYLFTVERHPTSGWPHIHGLLHFRNKVPARWIAGLWPFGYDKIKLSSEDKAKYVCKYILKTSDFKTRLRVSKKYGHVERAESKEFGIRVLPEPTTTDLQRLLESYSRTKDFDIRSADMFNQTEDE